MRLLFSRPALHLQALLPLAAALSILVSGCASVLGIEDWVVVDDSGAPAQDAASSSEASVVGLSDALEGGKALEQEDSRSEPALPTPQDADAGEEKVSAEAAQPDSGQPEAGFDAYSESASEAGEDGEVPLEDGSDTQDSDASPTQDAAVEDTLLGSDSTDAEAPMDAFEPGAEAQAEAAPEAAWDAPIESGFETGTIGCPGQPLTADETAGVFASPQGWDTPSCGARLFPCATLAQALQRAAALYRSVVYIAPGTYQESVSLKAGISLEGGWVVSASAWTFDCSATARDSVVVQAPANATTTLKAQSLGGAVKVSRLTLKTKPASQVGASESVYGVFATGASTVLTLEDVRIETSAAGHGLPGQEGSAGAAAPSVCASGSGLSGVDGQPGQAGIGSGFTSAGYVAGSGGPGLVGTAGGHGTAGGQGTCISCGSCKDVGAKQCKYVSGNTDSCGTAGVSGCAGVVGSPGTGGGGGGSSVGVWVWEAQVSILKSQLDVGAGGAGAPGGAGGLAGASTAGQAGTAGPLGIVSCQEQGNNCVGIQAQGQAGTAGGAGGVSGRGGPGGGGAGGHSLGVVRGGTASLAIDSATQISTSPAGPGAQGAPTGLSQALGP